ncbi:MAG: glycosyltransferase family 4 protein [Gemmatimonadetes bacterium]|nr:glycosyltransferase family 4 protein [Gemmatimonadota bacterium]
MRVLFHCVYFPPEVGGLESHIHFLARGLVERGHEVDVVTSLSQPDLARHEVKDRIGVWRTWLPWRNPVGWALHALGSVPRTRALARTADVVHAQAFQSVLPCRLSKPDRTPLVTTLHTSHFLKLAGRPWARRGLAALVRMGDHNFAASKEIADVGVSLGPGIRVEALANGVDTGFFRRVDPTLPRAEGPTGDRAASNAGAAPRLRLVAPRRLFHKNGVEYLIRAMPSIAERIPVELVVVGDGPEGPRLKAMTSQLGLDDTVRFVGSRPHPEMPGLLSSCDLAVFPSLMEATSVGALEAMACQLPVAASDVGGLPEIIDQDVGTLFEPADPSALAQAVVALAREGKLLEKGRRARERVVERWSNDRLVDRHLQVYETLLRGTRRTGSP